MVNGRLIVRAPMLPARELPWRQRSLGGLQGHTVDPHQFLGLEVNQRAAAIAELVLWIGHLQWHVRTKGGMPSDPILRAFKNIVVKDAVLDWRGSAQVGSGTAAADGRASTRPDGREHPQRPTWPDAEFIVGNPPFIGGKDIRGRLGDAYAEALWVAHPRLGFVSALGDGFVLRRAA
jgi:hypothetical protein